jgi:RimJ/RimL family protein N-acetyltransferase
VGASAVTLIGRVRDAIEVPRGAGPRLLLRALRPGDLPALRAIHEDPHPESFAHDGPWWGPASAEERMDLRVQRADSSLRRNGRGLIWAVVDRRTDTLTGWICLRRPANGGQATYQLSVRFDRTVWGRGYWTEAGGAATSLAFRRLGARTVYLLARPDNPATTRGAARIGYTRTGTVVDPDGQLLDRLQLDVTTWRRQAGTSHPDRLRGPLLRSFRRAWTTSRTAHRRAVRLLSGGGRTGSPVA